ncbi:ribose-5-phosphate isomerase [Clostridia bacterium]|nr:ribose-5-phosphate isomerase [Clostridia bacterium]
MIYIGSDHGGFALKQLIMAHLIAANEEIVDCGSFNEKPCDYPDVAKETCAKLLEREAQSNVDTNIESTDDFAVLICGTGMGMAIAANKIAGIRAGVVSETYSARMAREHNNANVICIGARVIGHGLALDIVDAFKNARFEGGRHARRVGKIEN